MQAWLAARSPEFRAAVEVVVIDPRASYAAALRAALPQAVIAVDHFHLVMLGNRMVTAVRQRVTRDLLGRRGRKIDPAWVNRRLLLRGRERLSQTALSRMWNGCVDQDPSGQILSAWIAKEQLRLLCALVFIDQGNDVLSEVLRKAGDLVSSDGLSRRGRNVVQAQAH